VASTLTLKEAADRAGVTPATLKRWAQTGVIPGADGKDTEWTPAVIAHARIVARLRARGHTLEQIRRAGEEGRLAYGFIEDLFPDGRETRTLDEVAEETGLEPALITRIWTTLGFSAQSLDSLTPEDVQALRYVASVLDAGFPLVAFLQLSRVYGQTLSQVADAETRLFHL
jgi:adenylate cyclase